MTPTPLCAHLAKVERGTMNMYRVYVRRYPAARRFRAYSSVVPLAEAQATAERIARDLGWDVEIRPFRPFHTTTSFREKMISRKDASELRAALAELEEPQFSCERGEF